MSNYQNWFEAALSVAVSVDSTANSSPKFGGGYNPTKKKEAGHKTEKPAAVQPQQGGTN